MILFHREYHAFCFALALAVHGLPVAAATFIEMDDPVAPCGVLMQGTIEPGDLEKFVAVYKENQAICLDSPGGDFQVAIKITNFISDPGENWGRDFRTVIGNGHRCLSACALIFMGGVEWYEGQILPNRRLHVGGELGFHAPQLLGPRRPAMEEAELIAVYDRAVDDFATLFALFYRIQFPDTLVAEMVRTPSNQMFLIETVQKANFWDIDLFGFKVPQIDRAAVAHYCDLLLERKFHYPHLLGRPGLWLKPEAGSPSLQNGRDTLQEVIVEEHTGGVRAFVMNGMPPEGTGKCVLILKPNDIFPLTGGHLFETDDHMQPYALSSVEPWQMLPASTSLKSLVAPTDYQSLRRDSTGVRTVQYHLNRRGFRAGAVDGVWGPTTKGAFDCFGMALQRTPGGSMPNPDNIAYILIHGDDSESFGNRRNCAAQ